MSITIYGNTVGTPTSPKKIEEVLNPVKTVNGKAPDKNGNVKLDRVATTEPMEDDIPKIFFGGALQQTKTEAVVPFRYISKANDLSGYAEIKAQGNSSMNYPKKNQTIKLFKDAECTEKFKVDFKGWGKQNKFVIKANWIDLSHARNVVSSRLWADVVKTRMNYAELPELLRTSPNQGAMDGFPVKVYANGVYQGRYTMNIPKDKWAFNMNDDLNEHCVLCGENYGSGCFRAAAKIDESDWTDEIHDVVPDSIKTRWNEVIRFVMTSTDAEFKANLENYFDVESLIDYHLFGLATCGFDAYGKNQLYLTYDGQKWIASMYDMDSTFGLYWNGSKFVPTDYPRTSYEDFVSTDESCSGEGNLLYIRLEGLFSARLKARWAELRSGALSIDSIINRFERFTDITPSELVKEDYAPTTGSGRFTGIPSQNTNNIQQIRAFALARRAWTDEYVANMPSNDSEGGDYGDIPEECNHKNTTTSITEATCTTAGKTVVTCTDCGNVISTTTTPALSHDHTYTSNEDGTHTVGCSRCDYATVENCNLVNDVCSACGHIAPPKVEMPEVLYENHTATEKFMRVVPVNFNNGDYIEASVNLSDVPSNYTYFSVGGDIAGWQTAENIHIAGYLDQVEVNVLSPNGQGHVCRKTILNGNGVNTTTFVVRVDKDGIWLDGNEVAFSGYSNNVKNMVLEYLASATEVQIGCMLDEPSAAVYNYIKVVRLERQY